MKIVGWLGIVLLLGSAVGCDWVTKSGPEQVRLRLDGEAETVTLVTTDRFLVAIQPTGAQTVTVLAADTTRVSLPFERTYNIEERQRFLARAVDVGGDRTLRFRAWLDGDNRFDRTVPPVPVDSTLQFLYVFNTNQRPDDSGQL